MQIARRGNATPAHFMSRQGPLDSGPVKPVIWHSRSLETLSEGCRDLIVTMITPSAGTAYRVAPGPTHGRHVLARMAKL
jgi:hypothetical protein